MAKNPRDRMVLKLRIGDRVKTYLRRLVALGRNFALDHEDRVPDRQQLAKYERRHRAPAADRAHWDRWYKANRKYQRQLRALHGLKIHPNLSSLRLADIP